ncbi:unnamed protein product, partial [Discosporangium mesarthrocarpum]
YSNDLQDESTSSPVPPAVRSAARQLGDFLDAPFGVTEVRADRTRAQTRTMLEGLHLTALASHVFDEGCDFGSAKLPKYPLAEIGPEPQTYRDVLNSEYRDLWFEAMERELTGLQSANAFSPTNLPPERKTIGAKWIYKWKTDEMGIVTRAKARLVAKGYNQKLGVDYFET